MLNRWQTLSLIFGSIGIIGVIIGVLNWISGLRTALLQKITTGLDLLTTCGLTQDKTSHIHSVLLEAQKQLIIQDNYETAKNLYNSVSSELYFCKPLLQADPQLMLFTLVALISIFLIVRVIRETLL